MEHESTGRPTSDSGVEAETPARRQTDTLSREADSQPRVAEHADANANAHEHAGAAGAGQKVGQTKQICLSAGAEHASGGRSGRGGGSQWLTLRTCKHTYAGAARCTAPK